MVLEARKSKVRGLHLIRAFCCIVTRWMISHDHMLKEKEWGGKEEREREVGEDSDGLNTLHPFPYSVVLGIKILAHDICGPR